MVRSRRNSILSLALFFSILGGVFEASAVRAAGACDEGDLDGTFSFVIHGDNPLGQSFGAIGVFTADGSGNISGVRISNDNGDQSIADFTCEYSMAPNCTFRTGATCLDVGEVTSEVTIYGALADNGDVIHLLLGGVPPGGGTAVVTGIAQKQ